MNNKKRKEIVRIAKEFTEGLLHNNILVAEINGSGWFLVDPLSGFLSTCGYHNNMYEIPETDEHPQVLMIVFEDGDTLIPAGGDLSVKNESFHNWMWLDGSQIGNIYTDQSVI